MRSCLGAVAGLLALASPSSAKRTSAQRKEEKSERSDTKTMAAIFRQRQARLGEKLLLNAAEALQIDLIQGDANIYKPSELRSVEAA